MPTDKFQKTVLFMLTDMHSKIDTLTKLHRNGRTTNTPVEITRKTGGIFDVKFPIGYETLKEVELLLQDEEEQQNAISIMKCWGGSDLRSITRRALRKTFQHELVLNMNWIGANEKIAFRRLKLKDTIIAAINQNPNLKRCSEVTDYDIEIIIQKWLKYKGDRNGGRTKRAKRALQGVQSPQNSLSHREDKDLEIDSEQDKQSEPDDLSEPDDQMETCRYQQAKRCHSTEFPQQSSRSQLAENPQRFVQTRLTDRLQRFQYTQVSERSHRSRDNHNTSLEFFNRAGYNQPF